MKLVLLAAAWLGGVLLGLETDVRPAAVYLLFGAALFLGAAAYAARLPLFPAVIAVFLLAGIWRVDAFQTETPPLASQDQQEVTVQGRVSNDPDTGARRPRFELEVTSIDRGDGAESAAGRLLVYADPSKEMTEMAPQRPPPYFRHGDILTLSGSLGVPPPIDDFDYPAHLASRGISGVLFARTVELTGEGGGWRGAVFSVRNRLSESLRNALPYPHSSLSQALLLGKRDGLPPELVDQFRQTGAAHLLAISGLHVGVVLVGALGASAAVLGRQRHLYLLVPLIAVWAYALVSGGSPSVMRAAAMGTVYLATLAIGRPNSVLPALALAAAVMTAASPGLLQRVSFQLSFTAVAGIALAHSYGSVWWPATWGLEGWRQRLVRPVLGLALVSVAASLASWPLVASYFDTVTLSSVPVTLLAVPAMPFILAGSLLAALLDLANGALGQFAGTLVWVPLSYLIEVVSNFPAWNWRVTWADSWLAAGWYGGLLLLLTAGRPHLLREYLDWTRAGWRRSRAVGLSPSYAGAGLAAIALAVAASILWLQAVERPSGLLQVDIFDVGQGDSILVTTPAGRRMLVDGGPDLESATAALSEAAGGRALDLVVLTHMDADHSRGLLEILDRYDIGAVMVGKPSPGASMEPQWQGRLRQNGISPVRVSDGYQVRLDAGVTLDVLNPVAGAATWRTAASNNDGVVLRLAYESMSFLFAADIEKETEARLARRPDRLASTVIKVAHHGSSTSSTGAFLGGVAPEVAVISAGTDNPFGHPSPEVVQRLEGLVGPSALFRTDRDGDVTLITDGAALWVETDR